MDQSSHEKTSMMKAVRAYGPTDFRLEDVCVPKAGRGQIVLRVLAAGFCSSDTKMYKGASFYWGDGGRVVSAPVTPGHEFVGEITEIGPSTSPLQYESSRSTLQIGQIVVVEQAIACQNCWFCRSGRHNKCDRLRIYGQGVDGAMAEYILIVESSFIHIVPPSLAQSPRAWQAAFAEPLAVSVHAVARAEAAIAGLEPGNVSKIVVAGLGAIGIGIVAALRRRFPADTSVCIVALDKIENRLKIARKAGADQCLKPNQIDQLRFGERGGCDVYFESTGHPASVQQGIRMLRKRGVFVAVSVFVDGSLKADWNAISAGKELIVVGSSLGRGAWPTALEMIADSADVFDQVMTHRIGLGRFRSALGMTMDPNQQWNAIKMVLDPTMPLMQVQMVEGAAMAPHEEESTPKAAPKLQMVVDPQQNLGPFSIENAVVWVTGSSRGIGLAIADRLHQLGAFVAIHGSTENSPSKLPKMGKFKAGSMHELAQQLGSRSIAVVGDLTSKDTVRKAADTIRARFGRGIDVLVCCAGGNTGQTGVSGNDRGGMPTGDDAVFVSEVDTRSVLDRNLLTSVLCCQEVAPAMIQSRRGRIVLIGSVAGCCGRANGTMYAVAKAAQHQYGKCLAAQMKEFNVPVNIVAPGPTMTSRYVANLGDSIDKLRIDDTERENLTRYAQPEDTAEAVAMLMGKAGAYISGQVIRVDGAAQLFAA